MTAGAARAWMLAAAFFPALPVAAAPPCTDWKRNFFEIAHVTDVRRCLDAGAWLGARTENGWTPLHRAAAAYNESPAVVQALLDAGAAVDARDEDGETPLHRAAAHRKSPEVVQALLDAGAAVDARNDVGWTPLHVAAWFSETPAVVQVLLDAGANQAARAQDGKSPWDYAQENAALKGTDAYWRLNEGRFE